MGLTELLFALAGLILGSGPTAIALAVLNRKWQKQDKLDSIEAKLDKHIQNDDERYAKQCRTRILRFNDELIRGDNHTQEHFNDVLGDITDYGNYCDSHKDFKNEKAVMAIENVRRVYRDCEKDGSFLPNQRM